MSSPDDDVPDPSPPQTFHLRSESVSWRSVGQELAAFDAPSKDYLRVNRTGAILWTSLAEGATRKALVEMLVERFRIPWTRAAVDVDAFVSDLARRGLLAPSAPTATADRSGHRRPIQQSGRD